MTSRHGFVSALLVVWLTACAGSQPAAPAPPSAPTPVASDARALAPPAPTPSASAPTSPLPVASSTPPAPPITPICEAKCDHLVAKCGKVSIENCRLNCGKYDPPPAGCGDQVRAALECARDAKDLTCANVAPESCSALFREIAACSSGVAIQKPTQAPAGLPEGWERVSDSTNGFSVAMPKGSVDKQSGTDTVRAVTAADGTTYSVSVLPVPTEKPSEKTLLHLMMKIQGRCSDKLRLDGFVEKAGRSSIHFVSHCPDKTDWDGMLYIGAKHMVMLSAQAPAGKIGITEPFFYGFAYTAP